MNLEHKVYLDMILPSNSDYFNFPTQSIYLDVILSGVLNSSLKKKGKFTANFLAET